MKGTQYQPHHPAALCACGLLTVLALFALPGHRPVPQCSTVTPGGVALVEPPEGAAVRALDGCERVSMAGAGDSARFRAGSGGPALPLVVEPSSAPVCVDGDGLAAFASAHEEWVRALRPEAQTPLTRPQVRTALEAHGALLFRGWSSPANPNSTAHGDGDDNDRTAPSSAPPAMTAAECERAVLALEPALQGSPPTTYVAGASPRSALNSTLGHVSSSTDMSAHFPIFSHLEMAYTPTPPETVAFCALSVGEGLVAGETPLVDMAAVYDDLPPATRAVLSQGAGFRLTRNFKETKGTGAMAGYKSWMDVLQTSDRAVAAERCAASGAACSWRADASMKMVTELPAVAAHPGTGRPVWLNALHSHSAVPYVRASRRHAVRTGAAKDWAVYALMRATAAAYDAFVAPDAQVVHASFVGDPADRRVPAALLLDVVKTIEDHHVHFTWQAGDVLLLDNLRVAHGREPFSGGGRRLGAVLGKASDVHGWAEGRAGVVVE